MGPTLEAAFCLDRRHADTRWSSFFAIFSDERSVGCDSATLEDFRASFNMVSDKNLVTKDVHVGSLGGRRLYLRPVTGAPRRYIPYGDSGLYAEIDLSDPELQIWRANFESDEAVVEYSLKLAECHYRGYAGGWLANKLFGHLRNVITVKKQQPLATPYPSENVVNAKGDAIEEQPQSPTQTSVNEGLEEAPKNRKKHRLRRHRKAQKQEDVKKVTAAAKEICQAWGIGICD
ncbi:hypothetical protein L596_007626 [Steinernema carpocapsae]|uniref:Uncharacterized protein n=1 Tax=Steinernema carpocapsae TaxID=34508 RepID=A0A4U5PA23_STECR|nr:hypothetical protein L596_007626 [Steinernema carpocapsae]